MIQAMQKEMNQRRDYLGAQEIETVYFGGGTPSLLAKEEIAAFINKIQKQFNVSDTPEITLEANPDDCTTINLKNWKEIGINRLSIGLQSFKSSDLEWMNRAHTVDEAKNCIVLAKEAGFSNFTVDLMYGLPGLTETEWRNHIQTVIDWNVPHISSYCLTVESNTVLEKRVHKGELRVADDEMQGRQFEILVEMLEDNGILQYEISNFSKQGYQSRHNSNYWKGVPYLGIGPSAHSFQGNSRQWNIANNALYMKALESGEPYFELEVLSSKDQFNELLLTGLRTVYGVSLPRLASLQSIPIAFLEKVSDFKSTGWLTEKNDHLYLTKEGRLRADYIASELFV